MTTRYKRLGLTLFWTWSFIFSVFIFAGLGPTVLGALLQSAYFGDLPWDFALFTFLLIGLPFVFIPVGFYLTARRPGQVLALFYGLQGPVLFLCLVRLFLVRELNPATSLVLALMTAAMLGFAGEIAVGHRSQKRSLWRLALASCGAVVALYCATVLAFYSLPLGYVMLEGLVSVDFWSGFAKALVKAPAELLVFVLFGGSLLLYTASLFVALPYAFTALYWQWWQRTARAVAAERGWPAVTVVTALVLAGVATVFFQTTRQPQAQAFALLEAAASGEATLRAQLAEAETIRSGLLNAYLAPYRYISSRGENRHIADIYREVFDLGPAAADAVQAAYNEVATPLLYDGISMRADSKRAQPLYEAFFDAPIQKGERAAVRHALNATYERDGIEAGLLDVEERNVLLVSQAVAVEEHGSWAEIEVHESYENQTDDRQEVLYYFTLPPTAVVSGLWLGTSADRGERDRFVVSPRGAAQRVYRRLVQRRVDPSLLEQIGPSHYRLRVFPIPPRQDPRDSDVETQRMHLWFNYKTVAIDGRWPMPELTEARNIYWDRRTVRLVNDAVDRAAGDGWLDREYRASASPAEHVLAIDAENTVRVTPLVDDAEPALPAGEVYAVVVDRSYSMNAVRHRVEQSIGWLREEIERDNDVDVYLTASPSRRIAPQRVESATEVDLRAIEFYGGQKNVELLRQFVQLRDGRDYDAVLVLTDAAGFDLAAEHEQAVDVGAPVWIVQLGDDQALGYDDASAAAITMHGGATASSVREALHRIALARRHGVAGADIADGYVWRVTNRDDAAGPSDLPTDQRGFGALAARHFIRHRMRGGVDEFTALRTAHEAAMRFEVVSPYSSMIVLINAQQRAMLAVEEKRDDRFERAVESGIAELSKPMDPFATSSGVTATPEPAEWLLLTVATLLLATAARQGWLDPPQRDQV